MRETIVALAAAGARTEAQQLVNAGAGQREVALAVMRSTRGHFMAPSEGEAFAAAVAMLWELYPDDAALRQEVAAIGDRNKVMLALLSGVPVALDEVELTPFPAHQLGLLELFEESGQVTP